MTILVFTPDRNLDKRDFDYVFRPEAERYIKIQEEGDTGCELVEIDISKGQPARLKQVLAAINLNRSEGGCLTGVAFFCHGWNNGIQLGINTPKALKLFASTVRQAIRPTAQLESFEIPLYCCSTGEDGDKVDDMGDGGFADRLRDALCAEGLVNCSIDAHTVKGHATANPYVRRFEGLGSPVGGTGGVWIVAPKSKLWPKWKAALSNDPKKNKSTLRFRFPYMPIREIHRELLDG